MMWSSQEIVNATGGTLQGLSFVAESVGIDSRKLQHGALFVALKGDRVDGHDYAKAAFASGAVAALVDHVPEQAKGCGAFIIVPDVYEAMLSMARTARARMVGRIIAITGSVGKTGTKEAIRMAAGSVGKVYATQGNLNNHIGLPLSLCNLPRDAAFGVFEMGMNHAGEIAFLTRLARPDVAVITNVEAVHLEFFSGIEAIASAKSEIMEGITAGGVVVLNRDNAMYDRLLQVAKKHNISRVLSFGEHEEADCRLMHYAIEYLGSRIEARIFDTPITYRLAATGKHWAIASLAALAAVTAAGADLANSAAALAHFQEPDGRGKLHRVTLPQGAVTLIDDCYNASPVSVKAALAKLAEVHQSLAQDARKIAILGDMLELGVSSPELHRALLVPLQAGGVDKVFACGAFMKSLFDLLPASMQGAYAPDATALTPKVMGALRQGDVILIKGSRGSRMDIVRDALQNTVSHTSLKEQENAL
jgi:UDP-N-acetylmuramoyl-tripeptide--D-alanyl-D-alanine ligase